MNVITFAYRGEFEWKQLFFQWHGCLHMTPRNATWPYNGNCHIQPATIF